MKFLVSVALLISATEATADPQQSSQAALVQTYRNVCVNDRFSFENAARFADGEGWKQLPRVLLDAHRPNWERLSYDGWIAYFIDTMDEPVFFYAASGFDQGRKVSLCSIYFRHANPSAFVAEFLSTTEITDMEERTLPLGSTITGKVDGHDGLYMQLGWEGTGEDQMGIEATTIFAR
ncbi:hypothetical protein BMG03_00945 [Thioclava nitratireducens]|uniref:Uncharacterized protein n=1 Tax=Thioclava nitratireducens TaxID=1915078 RepID=A0ABN4X8W2_9RHOB|nr:hypothetical protein [Thioclava nitratireducens]AQS46522.1 hypothetical protein BMG03_00945 [Thioclava nitratireducens]